VAAVHPGGTSRSARGTCGGAPRWHEPKRAGQRVGRSSRVGSAVGSHLPPCVVACALTPTPCVQRRGIGVRNRPCELWSAPLQLRHVCAGAGPHAAVCEHVDAPVSCTQVAAPDRHRLIGSGCGGGSSARVHETGPASRMRRPMAPRALSRVGCSFCVGWAVDDYANGMRRVPARTAVLDLTSLTGSSPLSTTVVQTEHVCGSAPRVVGAAN
jgi:hypothetical protein